MKVSFLIVLALLAWVDPATVKKINNAKAKAEEAFKSGKYGLAVQQYQFLVDSMGVTEDAVIVNLANALYLAKDTANAFSRYQAVEQSSEPEIRSKANQQMGLMANQQGRPEEALNYFKQAIRAEPSNDDARYNYELLKKKLEEKKKQEEEQQQKNKDEEKQDEQNKDQQSEEQKEQEEKEKEQQQDQQKKDEQGKDQQQKDQEQKEKEQQEQEQKEQEEKDRQEEQEAKEQEMPNLDREKLEEMKISEEKARMILEAMKNQEKQYLQQQKRKPTQSRDRNKPDW